MVLSELLRKHTKIILWITVFAFVGFIFLVWGMDIQSTPERNPTVIGVVNGQKIPTSYFRDMLNQAYQQTRDEKSGRITEAEESRLRQMTWDRVVNEMLLQQQLRKRNIGVTDEEVAYYLRSSPPPEVAQNPAFQTDGQFDPEKYRQILTNPAYDLSALEALVRSSVPLRKLEEMIISSAKVSENETRAFFEEVNQKVDFSLVLVRPNAFPVNPDSIPSEELRAFYDGNPELFRLEEAAKLRFMFVEKKPSARDESDAQTTANDIWREAKAGTDFAELATTFSEGPEAAMGGDINRFVSRGDLPPEFVEPAFSLEVGEISSPFRDRKGFHIIKLEEKKTEGGVEKVRYRRILIPFEPSPETLAELYDKALEASRRAPSSSLEQVAQELGFPVRETDFFFERGIVPVLPQDPTVKEFAFSNRVGTVSKPVAGEKGWYVLQVADRSEAHVPSFEDALPAVKTAAARASQEELARREIQAVASAMSQGAGLEQAAGQAGLSVEKLTSVGRTDVGFAVGHEPAVIGAAFALDLVGDTTPVLKGNAGFFILRLDARPPVDEDLYASQKEQLRMQLLQQKRMVALSLYLDQMRTSAKIADYRAEVLGF